VTDQQSAEAIHGIGTIKGVLSIAAALLIEDGDHYLFSELAGVTDPLKIALLRIFEQPVSRIVPFLFLAALVPRLVSLDPLADCVSILRTRVRDRHA
jgi:hypothetical protein